MWIDPHGRHTGAGSAAQAKELAGVGHGHGGPVLAVADHGRPTHGLWARFAPSELAATSSKPAELVGRQSGTDSGASVQADGGN